MAVPDNTHVLAPYQHTHDVMHMHTVVKMTEEAKSIDRSNMDENYSNVENTSTQLESSRPNEQEESFNAKRRRMQAPPSRLLSTLANMELILIFDTGFIFFFIKLVK